MLTNEMLTNDDISFEQLDSDLEAAKAYISLHIFGILPKRSVIAYPIFGFV